MTAASVSLQGPAPRDLVEVATTSPWCQRWRHGAHSWRHIHEGGFDVRRYSVEPIDEATARAWVCQHHYTSAYPAASHATDSSAATDTSSARSCSGSRCPRGR
jgi:hypothetical protein